MIFFFITFTLLYFIGIFQNKREYDYLHPQTTATLKGLFVLYIFLSHYKSYINLEGAFNQPMVSALELVGQLIVVPFLFYSGYGIIESVKRKGAAYIQTFPKKRIGKTLMHFDLAIILYFIYGLCKGNHFGIQQILLSLIAWENIGNSNWFIFAIICAYIATYISFKIFKSNLNAIISTTILCLVYVVILHKVKPSEGWWWDTMISFPLGMFLSYYRDFIQTKILAKPALFILALTASAAGFCATYLGLIRTYFINTNIKTAFFCTVVICITFIAPSKNTVLQKFGVYVFEVYILQRLSLDFFQKLGLTDEPILYFTTSFVVTLFLAVLFKKLTDLMDFRLKLQ